MKTEATPKISDFNKQTPKEDQQKYQKILMKESFVKPPIASQQSFDPKQL
jgi:hypothetical protein